MTFADDLRALNACAEAVEWTGDRTLTQAWRECQHSDWMLWLLGNLRIDTRRCAGLFALRVWHLVPVDAQLAAAWAIDCALRGSDRDEANAVWSACVDAYATDDAARAYAAAAAYDAAAAAAYDAARAVAAAYAAYAAYDAAHAVAAAYAAYDTARAVAAAYAAYDTARAYAAAERRAQCDIIRDEIPLSMVRAALNRRMGRA